MPITWKVRKPDRFVWFWCECAWKVQIIWFTITKNWNVSIKTCNVPAMSWVNGKNVGQKTILCLVGANHVFDVGNHLFVQLACRYASTGFFIRDMFVWKNRGRKTTQYWPKITLVFQPFVTFFTSVCLSLVIWVVKSLLELKMFSQMEQAQASSEWWVFLWWLNEE